MTDFSPNTIRAGALSALLLTAASSAQAGNPGTYNGVSFEGWDRPDQAEFVLPNVETVFRTGEPNVVRDIHIDCDLLVKDGDRRHPTTGFAIQFNAETTRTAEIVGESRMQLLKAWNGQLDYRASTVKGTIVHLEGAHEISRKLVGQALKTCRESHSDHGIDISQLGTNFGLYHPEYER